ncbi:uncharacterized protein LOC34622793 [Cyclospora cayetanensis]|uniref:Uncharacterized protein LOC34622793 n=1 Tax=Cyclospora cayetanensis TaxID=88456 RepID=A0A6P6S1A8_9EIME|nr:uncharacterized protein LOC34622793 [Cyclospora cayetanensis]
MAAAAVTLSECNSSTTTNRSEDAYRVSTPETSAVHGVEDPAPRRRPSYSGEQASEASSGTFLQQKDISERAAPVHFLKSPYAAAQLGGNLCHSTTCGIESSHLEGSRRPKIQYNWSNTGINEPEPCMHQDLRRVVASLLAAHKVQAEELKRLCYHWRAQHRALQGKVCRLKSQLRRHSALLASLVGYIRKEGPGEGPQWTMLEACLARLQGDSGELLCSSAEEAVTADETGWEASYFLSDSPSLWISKLVHWCDRIDGLPIASLGPANSLQSEPSHRDAGGNRSSVPAVAYERLRGRYRRDSESNELSSCEGQGLRVHLLSSERGSLSAAALRDAERFKDFIEGASLRQEAWLETFSSFAATAAPVASLSAAKSLSLELLDEAVTLLASDLLLLVAEALEPEQSLKAASIRQGMRVLCLLERSAAARCNIKSGRLRKGTSMKVFAFEPFAVCVQPNCENTDDSRCTKLTIPVCSLQGLKLTQTSASQDQWSSAFSASDREDSRETTRTGGGPASSSSNSISSDSSNGNGSNRSNPDAELRSGSSEGRTGEAPCRGTADGTPGPLPTGEGLQKRQRTVKAEKSTKERQDGTTHPGAGPKLLSSGAFGRGQEQLQTCTRDSSCPSNQPSEGSQTLVGNSSSRTTVSLQLGHDHSCRLNRSEGSARASGGPCSPGASRAPVTWESTATANRDEIKAKEKLSQEAGVSERRGASGISEGARSSNVQAVDGAPCSPKGHCGAPASEGNSSRSGAVVSVRCSGQAAQQQLERMQQQLPRVRAAVPKSVRQQLPAFGCQECTSFFDMMGKIRGCPGAPKGCSHYRDKGIHAAKAPESDDELRVERLRAPTISEPQQQRITSRHRQLAPPPSTPPGYWDL